MRNILNGERGTGNGEESILELELRARTSLQNENLVRNFLKASHASLKKDWYGGEKPG